jgi:tight adherence protein B
MSSTLLLPLIFLLAAASVGALLLVAFYPQIAAGSAFRRRVELVAAVGRPMAPQSHGFVGSRRKRSVEATLREADEKQISKAKKRTRQTLTVRIRQANLNWSRKTYWLVSAGTGIGAFLLTLLVFDTIPAGRIGIVAGLLLPHLFLKFRRKRRLKQFSAEFPNAIDIIVRGIQAGLPLVDCLKVVATESQEPVKSEFQAVVEDQALGMPLDEAVQRLPERIPLPEANFFAIVIAIQSRTGGTLSEALGNLSNVLRERKKMRDKVQAMSGEAKASAVITGALPIVVGGLMYLTSPNYISLLFTTDIGKVVLAACALSMLAGTLVMRKMINFEM